MYEDIPKELLELRKKANGQTKPSKEGWKARLLSNTEPDKLYIDSWYVKL